MNLIVLPNSNVPELPYRNGLHFAGILWYMSLVGLPIALITARYYDSK